MGEPQSMTQADRAQIAEVLERRANEIAGFSDEYRSALQCQKMQK